MGLTGFGCSFDFLKSKPGFFAFANEHYNFETLFGKRFQGTRVTVGALVGLVAAGKTTDEIVASYPYVTAEDIAQALSYAAWRAEEVEISLPA